MSYAAMTKDAAQRSMRTFYEAVKDETIIAVDEGAVVLIEESEWGHIKETLRLLSDTNSLSALIESHAIREHGQKPKGITHEDAFNDV